MATSYAFPLNGTAEYNSNNHVHPHTRSHLRKAAPDRLPLVPTSLNGGLQRNGEFPDKAVSEKDLHGHSYSRSLPQNGLGGIRQAKHQHFHSTVHDPQLPLNTFDYNHSTSLGIMEQTSPHEHAHSERVSPGYACRPANSHSHEPDSLGHDSSSNDWITATEALTSTLVPLPYILMTYFCQKSDWTLDATHEPQCWSTSQICAFTSSTLLSLGVIGKLRGTATQNRRRRASSSLGHRGGSAQNGDTTFYRVISQLVERICAVGAPFSAGCMLGGSRVAIFMLAVMAGGLLRTDQQIPKLTSIEGWKRLLVQRKWLLTALMMQIGTDFYGVTNGIAPQEAFLGYLLLGLSVFFCSPPYPSSQADSPATVARQSGNSWEKASVPAPDASRKPSPLTTILQEPNLTLIAGGISAFACIVMYSLRFLDSRSLSLSQIVESLVVSTAAALSFTLTDVKSLTKGKGLGLACGLAFPVLFQEMFQKQSWSTFAWQGVLIGCAWIAIQLDAHAASSHSSRHRGHEHHHHPGHIHIHGSHSRFTDILLSITQQWPLLHSILVEKDSRRIFYFMCLNFGFMLVQTFYALVTGSLGLLSDSIHMLFDCLALVVGLCAAVMSKWPPSIRFPYGFGKMDTLAGFANGIFLMLISVEIVYEAVERLVEGSQMQRIGELLTVSSLGLMVNLVGMFAFGHAHHGHGHSHGDEHSHDEHAHSSEERSHSHSSHRKHPSHEHHHHHHMSIDTLTGPDSPLPFSVPATPSKPPPKAHSHGHHHHGNENMHGIFLHVLADTLGSVAVVISTICIHYTGWAGFDPLASCLIAILIFASAVPLVTSSAKRLLLAVPEDTEFDLREALAGVGSLRGVSGVCVPRFWTGDGEGARVGGVMHVLVGRGEGLDDVRERALKYLNGRGMDVLVQVEREGEGRCWCGGGIKNS